MNINETSNVTEIILMEGQHYVWRPDYILQLAIAVSVRFMFSVTDLYNTIQSYQKCLEMNQSFQTIIRSLLANYKMSTPNKINIHE